MPDYDLTDLKTKAQAVCDLLARYEAVRAEVLEYRPESGGYLFDVLARDDAETEICARRIGYLAKLNPKGGMTPTRVQALRDRGECIGAVEEIFAGAHAEKVSEGMCEEEPKGRLPGDLYDRFAHVVADAREAVTALAAAYRGAMARIEGIQRNDAETKIFRKESDMPENANNTQPALHGDATLVDAVSRLHGGGVSAGSIAAEAGAGAFDRLLGQRIGMVLGVPDLNSDAARSQPAAELLEKLQNGLNRSVTQGLDRGETRFRFDPISARGNIGFSDSEANGAQAIIAQTVRALREPFRSALYAIGSERHRGDWQEGDDLREAALRGFDDLIAEAQAPTGPFNPHVEVIARQIVFDTMELAVLGDVIEKQFFLALTRGDITSRLTLADSDMDDDLEPGDNQNPDWIFWRQILGTDEIRDIKGLVVPQGSPAEIATRDPDLAFLAPEANEAALVAALGHLRSAYRLITRDSGAGAILGRIRARNDALAALAPMIPSALSAVGLSTADQAAIYLGNGGEAIDLGRLLAWIEDSAMEDRATLTRPDLNRSGLRRMQRVRKTQMHQANRLLDIDLPGIPDNQYAAGRREIAELSGLARGIYADLTEMLTGTRPSDDDLNANR